MYIIINELTSLFDFFWLFSFYFDQIQVRLGTQQFTLSGINFDVAFLFENASVGFDDPHRLHGSGSGARARVLYSFESARPGVELTVNVGDVVTVISKDPSGWWLVQKDHGEQGNVPANYLEELLTETLHPSIEHYEM